MDGCSAISPSPLNFPLPRTAVACPLSRLHPTPPHPSQYNVMARSQALVTWQRLLVGTAVSVAVPAYLLGTHGAMVVWATVLVVTAAAIYYCQAIIQGVVGDYIGGWQLRLSSSRWAGTA